MELTVEEYVSREEWRNASFPPCLKGRDACDCGLMRHGTYGRKTPIPMRVARFDCRACQTTISRLPDFAAARRRGSLQEIEDAMIALAAAPSRWAAARCLFPDRDELANAIRDLPGAFMAVSAFLEAVATLRPNLFRGIPMGPQWAVTESLRWAETIIALAASSVSGRMKFWFSQDSRLCRSAG